MVFAEEEENCKLTLETIYLVVTQAFHFNHKTILVDCFFLFFIFRVSRLSRESFSLSSSSLITAVFLVFVLLIILFVILVVLCIVNRVLSSVAKMLTGSMFFCMILVIVFWATTTTFLLQLWCWFSDIEEVREDSTEMPELQ